MRLSRHNLALIALAGLLVALPLLAAQSVHPRVGTIARQLKLKMELARQTHGDLSASLAHNRSEWQRLAPDAQDRYRREAYAFLLKNPQQQQQLLDRFGQFMEMSPQRQEAYADRAKWLGVVVASFTPQERTALEEMTPQQRASTLLERRALLTQQGKLPQQPAGTASGPSTQPIN